MTGRIPLEQVLADFRGEAAVLRANGHKAQADSIDRVVEAVAESMEAYLDRVTIEEAMLVSGRPRGWIQSRLPLWHALGFADRGGTTRRPQWLVRRCIIPPRAQPSAAYEAGRQGAA